MLQLVQRAFTRHLLHAAEPRADDGHDGAVTVIDWDGPATDLDIHLQCLALDGVCRYGADGLPVFKAGAAGEPNSSPPCSSVRSSSRS